MRGRSKSARDLIALLAMLTAGCGGHSTSSPVSSTAPTPIAPVPSGPTVALTGVVTDESGSGLSARVIASPLQWTAAWTGPPRRAQSNGAGQFQFATLPEHPNTVYVRAWRDGYVQQCATAVTLRTDTSVSLRLTTFANARITGLPASPDVRQISGVVYQGSGAARQPLAGVWVGWEPIIDTVVADTRTDAQGRYRLCGLPTRRIIGLFAVGVGTNQAASVDVDAGNGTIVDFELP